VQAHSELFPLTFIHGITAALALTPRYQ
jgi:hypothetical protein